MTEPAIPLWKQELLKRKQAKILLGNSGQAANNSNHRPNLTKHSSNSPNHVPFRNVKKSQFSSNHGDDRQESSREGTAHHRELTLTCHEDCPVGDTRQVSRISNYGSSSDDYNGPSRLDSFQTQPAQAGLSTGKFIQKFEASRSERNNIYGMLSNDRGRSQHNRLNTVIMVDAETQPLAISKTAADRWVDNEHIRPRDVKKMWQNQAVIDKNSARTRQNVVRNSTKTSSKDVSRGQLTPTEASSYRNTSKGYTTPPSKVPKAYKSPYAKTQWQRQTAVADSEAGKNRQNHLPVTQGVASSEAKPISSKENNTQTGEHQRRVEDEHIKSVKSLLGLFGGKAKPRMSRKISDNMLFGKKKNKQINGEVHHVSSTKTASGKRPGLFKHHSEPNLFFPAEFPDNSLNRLEILSPTPSTPADEVVSPSHQISQGIQERMTRLQKASLSSVEDMEELTDNQNLDGSAFSVENCLSQLASQTDAIQHKDVVSDNISMELAEKGEPCGLQNGVGEGRGDILFAIIDDSKKPGSSNVVDQRNEARISQSSSENKVCNVHLANSNVASVEEKELPKQSFDTLLSVFAPGSVKDACQGSDVHDISKKKSNDKHLKQQPISVVETSQSADESQNNDLSINHSNGIKPSQQKAQPVIKNESIEGSEPKTERKPRRKGLNVVDPLEVLQLTKDPILVKGKPNAAELGLMTVSSTGRKPKVVIIKHEPDKKAKVAQINRAWDLENAKPATQNHLTSNKTMPAANVPVTNSSQNIPVTSIDEIPVSVIDHVHKTDDKKLTSKSPAHVQDKQVGKAITHDKTLPSEAAATKLESKASEDEFIPVSSIDEDLELPPPPEIVFDNPPGKIKSSFLTSAQQKRGKISFFPHVFIHDYQSESAAAADWDIEHGMALSSYTPAAIKQYEGIGTLHKTLPPPVTQAQMQKPQTSSPPSNKPDDPLIMYNNVDSVDFSESNDNMAGAMLF